MTQERDVLEVDVLYVGGGIASLSSALHLSNLVKAHNEQAAATGAKRLDELTIAVIDKGFSPGAHGISGAVMAPGPLKDLVPDFVEKGAPLEGEVKKESIFFLTKKRKLKAPFAPPPLNNHGNYVVSMSRLNQWMADLLEKNGVDLFWEFAGVEVLYDEGKVIGVRTGDKGIDAKGEKKPNYEPGTDIHAGVTVFGEGSRGNLTKELIAHLGLDQGANPPAFEVGVKEVWELPEPRLQPGEVVHTLGYPLKRDTFGGGFIYGMKDNMVSVGQLVSLDYSDPYLDPHREFQKFKLHPMLAALLSGGKLVQYGAKTVPVGGLYSIPQLSFPGGLIIGDAGNLFNSQKIKGIDLAIRSGMLAARTIFDGLVTDDLSETTLARYAKAVGESAEVKDLRKVRNFHQGMTKGLYLGMSKAVLQFLLGGRDINDRLDSKPDWRHMKRVTEKYGTASPSKEAIGEIDFDGKLTFDKETDVYYSGATHEEAQPPHLKVPDLNICYGKCTEYYHNPCSRFCPAGVYEMTTDEATGQRTLQINFSNCVHCKTCDIKDPFENIQWVPPEGGGGPKYTVM
ncbi:MAG: electron transfer flavoprotein-ubiquinone oxidoreductase [Actinobacteria bacterium]|nr:electron transfer flavoprotein-ubiquinone oxidoreductase [Actinomycetota bacterium]